MLKVHFWKNEFYGITLVALRGHYKGKIIPKSFTRMLDIVFVFAISNTLVIKYDLFEVNVYYNNF